MSGSIFNNFLKKRGMSLDMLICVEGYGIFKSLSEYF